MEPVDFIYTNDAHREEDNIKEYIDSLEEGSVFYDLGANLGWFSLYASARGLKTYSFEIDRSNFSGLVGNVEHNSHLKDRIFIFNSGIADKKQTVVLRTRDQVIGEHHKTIDIPLYCGQENIVSSNHITHVDVDSLDNLIEENNLPYPDHLKVDIDGSEYSFLVGSPVVLRRAKSMVIELYTGNKFYEECIRILENNNFSLVKIYDIPGEPGLHNFVYSKDVEQEG